MGCRPPEWHGRLAAGVSVGGIGVLVNYQFDPSDNTCLLAWLAKLAGKSVLASRVAIMSCP